MPSFLPPIVSACTESGRFPPTKCSSRRSFMYLTGFPVDFANWIAMRSQASMPNLQPKPPPMKSVITRTFEASRPATLAASPWTLPVACVEHQSVSPPSASNSATDPCGSSATWSWTDVRYVASTFASASDRALSASPRGPPRRLPLATRFARFESTRGDDSESASVASTTCGRTSYSTSIARSASSRTASEIAQTAATMPPGNVIRSGPILSAASTPGIAFASSSLTDLTFAWACGQRRAFAKAIPGRLTSEVYFALPDAFARPSTRGTSVPTTDSFASMPQGGASWASTATLVSFTTSPAPSLTVVSAIAHLAFAAASAAVRTWG